jgi:hypothetical protein
LIKSYFNLYFSKKLVNSKPLINRFRRLAVNKVFISKAELKHTNSKVIITLYIYNEERRILFNRLKRMEAILFPYFNHFSTKYFENKTLSLTNKLSMIKRDKDNISFKL